MPGPSFTKTRGGKQPIHDLLVSPIGFIFDEGLQFALRRGKTGEHQRDAAQEELFSRTRGGIPTPLLQFRQDKSINLINRPLSRLYPRHRNLPDWLQGPPLLSLLKVKVIFTPDGLAHLLLTRIRRAPSDPLPQVLHLLGTQCRLGRHCIIIRITLNHPDEQAFLRFAGHNDFSAFTSPHPACLSIKYQATLDLL